MSQQAEISAYDLKAAEIFKLILEDGEPKTSYDLIFKKELPTATVHRHLNRMIKDNEITVYGGKINLRGKKPYGPTIYGLISYYGVDKEFTKNLERYFDLWIKNKQFRSALEEIGFDKKKMQTHGESCRKMFRILIEYCAKCEAAYDKLAEDPYTISYEGQQFIGGLLLANDKKANQSYEELYAFSETFRKGVDTVIQQILTRYEELQKSSKELKKKWE